MEIVFALLRDGWPRSNPSVGGVTAAVLHDLQRWCVVTMRSDSHSENIVISQLLLKAVLTFLKEGGRGG